MKSFRAFLLWAALAGAAIAQPGAEDANPAMLSFADLYALTVGGSDPAAYEESMKAAPASDTGAVRVAAAAAAHGSEMEFRVTPAREPERWLLLLAGLALAGWVAHRRLVNWS